VGLRLKRYGPVRTIAVVGLCRCTDVPAARNSRHESTKSDVAAITMAAPSGHSVGDAKGRGHFRFTAIPSTIAAKKKTGGLRNVVRTLGNQIRGSDTRCPLMAPTRS